MQPFTIWSEGFCSTGDCGGATRHATIMAESFQEACDKYFGQDKLYNSRELSYWGCKLFDNESDARKNFG